uniref:Protein kinase domain-containing protein n=1 Tax=Panagrolaimus davidi TaxID=227884 RepID=A0A914Q375_9BILA
MVRINLAQEEYDLSLKDKDRLTYGSSGDIFPAVCVATKKRYVIKMFYKGLNKKAENEKLCYEVLQNCPNVAECKAMDIYQGRVCLVLERGGCDLAAHFQANGSLNEIRKRFFEVFFGVKNIHEKEIFHNDLQLQNVIMVDQDGEKIAKIIDFGKSVINGVVDQHKDVFQAGNMLKEALQLYGYQVPAFVNLMIGTPQKRPSMEIVLEDNWFTLKD